jgi:nitrile hydratase accessory protein
MAETVEIGQAPGQPGDGDGPVFREPWEASAFAMAVALSKAGHFTWPEWVESLSSEIKAHDAEHHDDDGHDYYHIWFAALEKLLASKQLLDQRSVDDRHQYLKDHPVPHDHVARREPVCVA